MTHLRRSRLAKLAKLVVLVLVAVFAWPNFGEACCWGVELAASEAAAAKADNCCPAQAPREEPQEEHEGSCSCPLSCASGCSGIGRALAATMAAQVAPPGSAPLVRQHSKLANPPAVDPHDILHVPKPVLA